MLNAKPKYDEYDESTTNAAQMQQRPAWVDDLFRKMDKVESKLNKLDKIDTLVTSLNSKVTKLEVTTQSSDGRIARY